MPMSSCSRVAEAEAETVGAKASEGRAEMMVVAVEGGGQAVAVVLAAQMEMVAQVEVARAA